MGTRQLGSATLPTRVRREPCLARQVSQAGRVVAEEAGSTCRLDAM